MNPKNVFKRLKHALEVELQEFEISVNYEIFVCLTASQPAWPQEQAYRFNRYVYGLHTS